MEVALIKFVRIRAGNACEYCQFPQALSEVTFEIDHIIALKHHGPTTASNLALSCFQCNGYKGPNIAGVDPETKLVATLFNPRIQIWSEHFHWQDAELVGLTATGRATIDVLRINDPRIVALRQAFIEEGTFWGK